MMPVCDADLDDLRAEAEAAADLLDALQLLPDVGDDPLLCALVRRQAGALRVVLGRRPDATEDGE